ncbi:MAG: tetratricopeptide repeat protein [Verrucomicrobiia bacterium]
MIASSPLAHHHYSIWTESLRPILPRHSMKARPSRRKSWPGFVALAAALACTGPLSAQDKIISRTGTETTGEILGVSGPNVQIRLAAGTVGVRIDTIARVEKEPPKELVKAMSQLEQGEAAAALPELRKAVETFRGLPTDWARAASSALGAALVAENRLDEAEKAFEAFRAAYPGEDGSLEARMGLARIAVERGNAAEARGQLEPLAKEALARFDFSPAQARNYATVFFLLGRIEEAAGNKSEALQNYLRTTTLFPNDPLVVAEATRRVAELEGIVVP